jgi:hypothetical protein
MGKNELSKFVSLDKTFTSFCLRSVSFGETQFSAVNFHHQLRSSINKQEESKVFDSLLVKIFDTSSHNISI